MNRRDGRPDTDRRTPGVIKDHAYAYRRAVKKNHAILLLLLSLRTSMTMKNPPAIRNSFPWQRQETQLSLTNRLTHLCNVQRRGWPHKTRPSPCVLRRRILSFYVKYRRTPKWGTLEFWPLRKGCGWSPKYKPLFICVTTSNTAILNKRV